MQRFIGLRTVLLISSALAALAAPALSTPARAQGFVTGSGNTNGFSILGAVRDAGGGAATGRFTIMVHLDVASGGNVAAICNYRNFDSLVIRGNGASFHSVGSCFVLTELGTVRAFASDNSFSIVDNGEPGPGADTIDVNLVSGGGVTIPGSPLVDGNFLVSP